MIQPPPAAMSKGSIMAARPFAASWTQNSRSIAGRGFLPVRLEQSRNQEQGGEMTEEVAPGTTAGVRARSPAANRHYVLFVLLLAYISSYVDRSIVNIVMQPLKDEFQVSDMALGFLSGLAFAVFYATLGVPIAMWADRGNRRNIIALAVTVWSAMTVLCGMATNFAMLAAARIGVGIGEAGSSPPSHSIIADLYPKESRSTAMAVYALGIYFGAMIGLMLGGYIATQYGWRATFFVVGLPGLVIALMVRFTLAEPVRGHADGLAHDAAIRASVKDVFVHLWHTRSARHVVAGLTLVSFVGYGSVTFGPSFFGRSLGMNPQEIGFLLGPIAGIVGGLGAVVGGYLADRLSRRDVRWNSWIIALAKILGMPLIIVFYTSSDLGIMVPVYIVSTLLGAFYLGPSFAMIQSLTPLHMRALASAVMLFVLNFIALGFGPMAVGFISDRLQPAFGAESLRWALFGTSFIGLWAAAHYYWAGVTYREDLRRIEAGRPL
jgi:MFS family permease